ncbi:hypothetical protein G6011_04461 [Alternaria panax]|uniref:Uncharacterized protein n=1 Tax=Alternaria panax TaxID=48097 RepID=A0AAD4IGJ6_9PLEO|nr:hypothetical protein G6011_04461 [Alternaria panax]
MSATFHGAKVYLIHTTQHTRPFLTTVPFIARDFASWGSRVDHHAADSPYITEIRSREDVEHMNRTDRGGSRRTKLMEIWTTELVRRKRQQRGKTNGIGIQMSVADGGFGSIEARVKKAGELVQDVMDGLAAFGRYKSITPGSPCDIEGKADIVQEVQHVPQSTRRSKSPESPPTVLTTYTRHLYSIRYAPNAPLPSWANPDIIYADQVVLEFHHHEYIRKEQLVHAVSSAVGKDEGRMGRVEKCTNTGLKRVHLWVDVGDTFFGDVMREEGDLEDRDPVPKYERGEGPPAYDER